MYVFGKLLYNRLRREVNAKAEHGSETMLTRSSGLSVEIYSSEHLAKCNSRAAATGSVAHGRNPWNSELPSLDSALAMPESDGQVQPHICISEISGHRCFRT